MIKTFRLFVSSTFKDLNEERALLHDKVFPELESHCGLHGFGFRAIDTRWGVNEDAQLNQRAAEICLAEVRDAKTYPAPNLLILIGERYGWVPLPHAIAEDEYEAIHHWLASQSPTGRAAMLDRVYEYDGNHVIEQGLQLQPGVLVGAYTLRPRERASRNAEVWTRIEQDARMALQAGAHFLHGSGRLDDAGRDNASCR